MRKTSTWLRITTPLSVVTFLNGPQGNFDLFETSNVCMLPVDNDFDKGMNACFNFFGEEHMHYRPNHDVEEIGIAYHADSYFMLRKRNRVIEVRQNQVFQFFERLSPRLDYSRCPMPACRLPWKSPAFLA